MITATVSRGLKGLLHMFFCGAIVTSLQAQQKVPFAEGGLYGFKDQATNTRLIQPKYDMAYEFRDGIGQGGKEWQIRVRGHDRPGNHSPYVRLRVVLRGRHGPVRTG
jgi:hypothetical protein